jgi:hypothetical protein
MEMNRRRIRNREDTAAAAAALNAGRCASVAQPKATNDREKEGEKKDVVGGRSILAKEVEGLD